MNLARVIRTGPCRWAIVAPKQHYQQQQLKAAAALRSSSSAATVVATEPDREQPHHHHHRHQKGSSSPAPTRHAAAAVPPPLAWKVPAGQEASSGVVGTRQHVVLPQDDELQLQHHQVGPAPPGDLRLVEFMEQVKMELWEFSAMPLRKRFRIQSLLRRLHTPPLETWSHALARATEEGPRPFTRTLLARYQPASSLPARLDVDAPGFDLLLLCWRPGAVSDIHDHPKAACWVKVLTGEIKETRYSLGPPTHREITSGDGHGGENMVQTSSVTCTPGAVTYIEDSMGLHKMENPSSTEECISLHLYSPGILECTTWADASRGSKPVKAPMFLDGNFTKGQKKRRFDLQ
ncbi:unnamed protein product [Ectocarpus sp. 12 AP-2014]